MSFLFRSGELLCLFLFRSGELLCLLWTTIWTKMGYNKELGPTWLDKPFVQFWAKQRKWNFSSLIMRLGPAFRGMILLKLLLLKFSGSALSHGCNWTSRIWWPSWSKDGKQVWRKWDVSHDRSCSCMHSAFCSDETSNGAGKKPFIPTHFWMKLNQRTEPSPCILCSSQVVRALDSLADSNLNNGLQPGRSEVFLEPRTEEIRLFQLREFGSRDCSDDLSQASWRSRRDL
jgi:hypothetical protein